MSSSPATLAAGTPPPPTIKHRPIPPSLRPLSNFSLTLTKPTRNSNPGPRTRPAAIVDNPSTSEEEQIQSKVGARVRVTVPLKVYHIPKVPELELNGKEGKVKENVAAWRGKHISANLPYKIEFVEILEGRGDTPVKFFAHLKDDEFEYID